MGLPASGKTTLAEGVAGRLGLVHVSSDLVRKRLARQQPTAHGGERFGEGLYSQAMTQRTYAQMRRDAARWLRRGQSVVLDATFGKPAEREALRQLAARCDAQLLLAVCRASDATLQARLAARTQDATAVSDARPDLWPALKSAFQAPKADELAAALDVDTEQPMSQAVTTLVEGLLLRRPRPA